MAPDTAFEAWLAERADFAATSLLGLTLRPTFDAGWDARAATDRDAAPAAAEGADAELDKDLQALAEIEQAHVPEPYSMTVRGRAFKGQRCRYHRCFSGLWPCPSIRAARLARKWLSIRPAPAATPREDIPDWERLGDAMRGGPQPNYPHCGCGCHGYTGPNIPYICQHCDGCAAAREAARGEGEAR